MATQNPGSDEVAAAAAELRQGMSTLTPAQQAEAKSALGSIGDKWWLLLVLGVISLIAGLLIVFNPKAAVHLIAVFFGIWLLVSGIFTLVRGFGDKLDPSARVLSIIVGALSIVLGIMCFRDIADAVDILVLFIGIGLIMRGILEFVVGLGAKDVPGQSTMVIMGIVTLLLGIGILVWPNIGLATIVYFLGFSLILMAILEIISAFRVKAVASRIDDVVAAI